VEGGGERRGGRGDWKKQIGNSGTSRSGLLKNPAARLREDGKEKVLVCSGEAGGGEARFSRAMSKSVGGCTDRQSDEPKNCSGHSRKGNADRNWTRRGMRRYQLAEATKAGRKRLSGKVWAGVVARNQVGAKKKVATIRDIKGQRTEKNDLTCQEEATMKLHLFKKRGKGSTYRITGKGPGYLPVGQVVTNLYLS